MILVLGVLAVGVGLGFIAGAFSVFALCPSAEPVYTHKEHLPR